MKIGEQKMVKDNNKNKINIENVNITINDLKHIEALLDRIILKQELNKSSSVENYLNEYKSKR